MPLFEQTKLDRPCDKHGAVDRHSNRGRCPLCDRKRNATYQRENRDKIRARIKSRGNVLRECSRHGLVMRDPYGKCRECKSERQRHIREARHAKIQARRKKWRDTYKPSPEHMAKPCIKCGQTERNKFGDCKPCRRSADAVRRASNSEEFKARSKIYRSSPRGKAVYAAWRLVSAEEARERMRGAYRRLREGVIELQFIAELSAISNQAGASK